MKSGIPYFPVNCQQDEDFEKLEAEYGLIGFAVIIKLWQRIYSTHGYYCEWNDDVALVFAKNIGASAGVVSEIIHCALRRGIFDKGIFEKYEVLTSSEVQNNYLFITKRRKFVKIEKRYLLVNADLFSKSVYISDENVCNSSKNDDISEQRKGKNSKGKENNTSAHAEESVFLDRFNQFWELYPKKVSRKKALALWLKIKPDEQLFRKIIEALKQQINSEGWKKEQGQYIPYPTTWLNGARWEDETSVQQYSNQIPNEADYYEPLYD